MTDRPPLSDRELYEAYRLRGQFMDQVVLLETVLDILIRSYFQVDHTRWDEFDAWVGSALGAMDRVEIGRKILRACGIAQEYDGVFLRLRDAVEYRNTIAHSSIKPIIVDLAAERPEIDYVVARRRRAGLSDEPLDVDDLRDRYKALLALGHEVIEACRAATTSK